MPTLAIVSDIHANVVALDAVLADLDRLGVDRVVCLGDVAATGPAPRQVIARLRERDWRFVRGNCDDAMLRIAAGAAEQPVAEHDVIDHWCTGQLAPDEIAFLATFEPVVTIEVGGVPVCCYHGSPRSNLDEILPATEPTELAQFLFGHDAVLYCGGHTHVQMVRRHRAGQVVNPGSVGLPFTETADGRMVNPLWAEYAVLHVDDGRRLGVELRRTPVDGTALHEMASGSGMPCLDWWSGDWEEVG